MEPYKLSNGIKNSINSDPIGSNNSLPNAGDYRKQYPSASIVNSTTSDPSMSQVSSNPSIPHTAGSIGSYQSIPGENQVGSSRSTINTTGKPNGRRPRFDRTRVDSSRSVSTQQSSGSYIRVNIVTEAQSVLPSLTSAFSIEKIGLAVSSENVFTTTPPGRKNDFEQGMSSSYKDALDMLDNPAYTDTVKSTDSTGSALRRSVSVPAEYQYKTSSKTRRPMAREVFEDFIPKDEEMAVASKSGEKAMQRSLSDLYENPDYIDSIQSTSSGAALLARTAVNITKDGKRIYTRTLPATREEEEDVAVVNPTKYVKNLVVLSLSFMFIFTAYMSLRNLQSSINHDGGLALYALSTVYGSLFFGCVFAPTVVQRLRPKNTMVSCMVSFLIYVAANFYPHYYTLVPASAIVGFSLANMWTAHATYLTSIAANYAGLAGKNLVNVLGKFNGTFFMFFGMAQVLGGIISSTVLMAQPAHHTGAEKVPTQENASLVVLNVNVNLSGEAFPLDDHFQHCGAAFCLVKSTGREEVEVSPHLLYILLSIYAACTALGILIMAVFLDPLEGTMKKSHASLLDQLSAVFRWFWDWRVLCLSAMMFYTLIEMAFMFGEFTKAYVTCPYGVHMVGYATVCLSACSSLFSYINGKLLRYIGRMSIFIAAAVIHFSLMWWMLYWKPTEASLAVMFVITGFWGIADSIWFTQIISLLGVLFVDNKEAAFAGLKMCQALGACLNFVTANYMCTQTKIYILMALLCVAISTYIFLELKLKYDAKKERDHPKTRPPMTQ